MATPEGVAVTASILDELLARRTVGGRPADLSDALRTALAARRPYLINANISADKNPGGAGVWELPGLGQSQPAFGGRYQP